MNLPKEEGEDVVDEDGMPPNWLEEDIYPMGKGKEVEIPLTVPEVSRTTNMASYFRPSLFGQGKINFRSLFKKLVAKDNPLKRRRKEKMDLPGYVNLDDDDNDARVEDCESTKEEGSAPPLLFLKVKG